MSEIGAVAAVFSTALVYSSASNSIEECKRILHLKGYTRFYDLSRHQFAVQRSIEYIKDYKPDIIVWDGDELHHDSFTVAVKHAATHPDLAMCSFHAFVPANHRDSERMQHWQRELSDRLVVFETHVVPSGREVKEGKEQSVFTQDDYVLHGLTTMKQTGATRVLVLGLGTCVKEEIITAATQLPHVHFDIINVPREHNSGTQCLETLLPDGLPKNVTVLETN